MAVMTTKGLKDEQALVRTAGFEERPDAFVVWVEWRLAGELVRRDAHKLDKMYQPGETDQTIYTTSGLVPAERLAHLLTFTDDPLQFAVVSQWTLDDVIVRRDARVVLKQPSVIAAGIAGGF